MSATQIFERLHQEGYIKQTNIAKWYELKEEQELQECTFSPRTNNSPTLSKERKRLSPDQTINRLHYEDLEKRLDKSSKREAEKMQKFKEEHTFRPQRD